MADTTKNINQYSYNSPYVKTLTEEQAEALYPVSDSSNMEDTTIPVPKNMILHIQYNAQDSGGLIDYFVIGDGTNGFNMLPKHNTRVMISNQFLDSHNIIKLADDFKIIGDVISISEQRFPTSQQVIDLKNSVTTAGATLFSDSKQLYRDEDSKYEFDKTIWMNKINDSNGYDKTKSFFLYNFLNNIYYGKFINNSPLKFYAVAPLNASSNMKVQFFTNNDTSSILYSCDSMDSSGAWIFKDDNNNEIFRVYFAPITELQNSNYNMLSIYPYIYINVIDQTILNNNYTKVKIFNTENNIGEYNNADLYWVTCQNKQAKDITYYGNINMQNDVVNKSSGDGSSSSTNITDVRNIIAYLLADEAHSEYESLNPIKFSASYLQNQDSKTDSELTLPNMLQQIGYINYLKAAKDDVQNNYVKKPTTENNNGWTTLKGTGINADNDSKIKYSFQVYDYQSNPAES